MNRLLILLIFSFSNTFSIAQKNAISRNVSLVPGNVKGKITDQSSGTPLAGASVYFPDLRIGTITNELGEFFIDKISDGTYVVDVSYQGYAAIARTITISGATIIAFQLSTTAIESENVIITGVSKATELKKTPIPISIMKKQELYRSSATNIIEALTRKSGVSILTTGPAIAKPFIRGMGYSRVVTLNDGIRQEGQQWGDEHGIEIDEYSVQKAEVLRGPASLMYGSDALGGVINIISNMQVPTDVVKANFVASNNSNNRLWGFHGNVSGNISGINFSAYGSTKSAGDYQNKYDGYVLNSRFKEMDFGVTAGINRKWGYSHWSLSNFNQRTGMVEGDRNDDGKFLMYAGSPLEKVATEEDLKSKVTLVPNQHIRHFKVVSDNSFALGKGRLSAVLGWQQNLRQEFGDPEAVDEAEAFFDLQTFNYNAGYHFNEKSSWKTTLGLSGMSQTNTNKGEEAIIPDYDLFDAGLYLVTQKELSKKAVISGGARIDNRSMQLKAMQDDNGQTKFNELNRSFTNVSGSIGVSYYPTSKLTLKANISRGFRAPTASELAANGEHEGTNRYEIGQGDLKSESSIQGDLGLELNTDHISLGITPFFNSVSNYIYFEKLIAAGGGDSLTDVGNGDFATTYKFNQQNAKLAGLELNFDLHPHPLDWLHFENTMSYVRGWFNNEIDGSNNLPQIAPFRLISELRAEFRKINNLSFLTNTYFKLEMDANAAQENAFTAYNTETATPGFVLFNAGIGSDFKTKKGATIASFFLSLNNLTDKAYQTHMSRLKYTAENMTTGRNGVFNMGRNFTARLVVPLEWKVK